MGWHNKSVCCKNWMRNECVCCKNWIHAKLIHLFVWLCFRVSCCCRRVCFWCCGNLWICCFVSHVFEFVGVVWAMCVSMAVEMGHNCHMYPLNLHFIVLDYYLVVCLGHLFSSTSSVVRYIGSSSFHHTQTVSNISLTWLLRLKGLKVDVSVEPTADKLHTTLHLVVTLASGSCYTTVCWKHLSVVAISNDSKTHEKCADRGHKSK